MFKEYTSKQNPENFDRSAHRTKIKGISPLFEQLYNDKTFDNYDLFGILEFNDYFSQVKIKEQGSSEEDEEEKIE